MALFVGIGHVAHVHGTVVGPSRAPAGHTNAQDGFDDSSSRSGRTGDTNTNTNTHDIPMPADIPMPEAEQLYTNDALPSANATGANARHRLSLGTRRLQGTRRIFEFRTFARTHAQGFHCVSTRSLLLPPAMGW